MCDKQACCVWFQFHFVLINCVYIREKKCQAFLISLACDMAQKP